MSFLNEGTNFSSHSMTFLHIALHHNNDSTYYTILIANKKITKAVNLLKGMEQQGIALFLLTDVA